MANLDERSAEVLDLCKQSRILIENGKYDEADKKLSTAISLDPMVGEIYEFYGNLYMAKEEYKKAKKSYKQALLIEKKGELYFLYGNACFMNGDDAEGIENYNFALANGYDNEEMYFFAGLAYEHLNDDQNALRYYYRASQKNPARPDFKIRIISTLIRMNDLTKAEEQTDALIESSPELFDGYHIKNMLLLNANRLDEAEKVAFAAKEKFPEDVDLFLDYVRIIVQKGEHAKAIELIEQAKKMKYYGSGKRDFCMLEAQLIAEQNDYENAVRCCEECISLEKDGAFDGEARFMKLNLCYVQKHYAEALSLSEEFVVHQGRDSYFNAALYYKARCLRELGREEDASVAYKEAIAILRMASLSMDNPIETYLYRAMAHVDLAEYDKAIELLDFVDGLELNIAETHTIRAEIYLLQGNEVLQHKELEKAYEIRPDLRPEA